LSKVSEISYITDLASNDENKITIANAYLNSSTGGNKFIEGFIDADTVFTTSADYSNEQIGSSMVNSVTGLANTLKGSTGYALEATNLERANWTSSTFSPISWEIFILAEEKNGVIIDPSEMGKNIFDYTLLEKQMTGVFHIPGRYVPSPNNTEPENACTIKIGNWFYSYNSWVITNGQLTISKEKVKGTNGIIPLYVKVSLTAKPSIHVDSALVRGWFTNGS